MSERVLVKMEKDTRRELKKLSAEMEETMIDAVKILIEFYKKHNRKEL